MGTLIHKAGPQAAWLGRTAALVIVAATVIVLSPAALWPQHASAVVYGTSVFADGFESGGLTSWNTGGTGSATVQSAAARSGSFGLRLANVSGQYGFAQALVTTALADSSTSFSVRVNAAAGVQTLAQGRDQTSNFVRWEIFHDARTRTRSRDWRRGLRRCASDGRGLRVPLPA